MKFGRELDNVTFTIPPMSLAENNIFNTLKLLLAKIKDEKPEILKIFIDKVSRRIQKKVENKILLNDLDKLSNKVNDYANLNENLELVKLHLNYMMMILGITEEQLWQNEKTPFPCENFMTSVFVLFYIHQITLIELLGRENGLQFYREYVDIYNYKINAILQKDREKNLDGMREGDKQWLETNPYGRVRLYSEVMDGRLIRICKNCEKFTALQKTELTSDGEVLYNILCYMHIPLVKVWNENFILTLEKSLALGDPYCAYVYFDKRVAKEIEQPSDEYLNEIWSKYK